MPPLQQTQAGERGIALWDILSRNLGGIIGTSIFVLVGVSAGRAGPGVILSFPLVGGVALITALSAAELSSFVIRSRESYVYTGTPIGRFWGFLVGWMQSYDYMVGATLGSVGFAAYLTDFFRVPPSLEVVLLLGIFWPLLVIFIQFRRTDTSLLNRGSTLLKVAALVFFCAAGGWYLLTRSDFANYVPLFPAGVAGVVSGASINFFAFASFSTETLFSEGVRRQRENILLVLLVSVLVSTVLYMSVAWVAVGLVNWNELSSSPAPLTTAIDVVTDNTALLAFITVAAEVAISSAILASLSGGSQVFMAMARKEIFPDAVTRISRVQAPISPVLVSGLIVSLIIVATRGDIGLIATLFNFGTLMTYLFINASVIHLRSESPDVERAFRVPYYPYLPLAGAASCLILPFFLNQNAIITGSAWIVLGVATYYFYQKRAKRRVRRNSPDET